MMSKEMQEVPNSDDFVWFTMTGKEELIKDCPVHLRSVALHLPTGEVYVPVGGFANELLMYTMAVVEEVNHIIVGKNTSHPHYFMPSPWVRELFPDKHELIEQMEKTAKEAMKILLYSNEGMVN